MERLVDDAIAHGVGPNGPAPGRPVTTLCSSAIKISPNEASLQRSTKFMLLRTNTNGTADSAVVFS